MTTSAPQRSGVLCVGSIIADVGKTIDRYPAVEHLATIEDVSLSTGGPGLNMAVDLRMLGAPFPVEMRGAVGDDAHGDFVLAECARVGVATAGVRRLAGVATSFSDAMVERDGGRRTFFHYPGANALLSGDDLAVGGSRARILHAGAPGLMRTLDAATDGGNGWSRMLREARDAGLRTNLELVSIEASRIAELATPCLPHADSVVINELEAAALTGVDDAGWDGCERMARGLIERGVRALAVVHFPAGCVAADDAGRVWRQPSVRVPRELVRSTTGAGDAFAAGVLFGLHDGWPVEDCLRLAVAAAAACILSTHTSDGIVPAADCLVAAERFGHRG